MTSLTLEHGLPHRGDQQWARVTTTGPADLGGPQTHHEWTLEFDLWHAAWSSEHQPEEGACLEQHQAYFAELDRARARRPPAAWVDATLRVDGQVVAARLLQEGELWVAHASVDGAHVAVQAQGLAVDEVELTRVSLDGYEAAGA